MEIYIVSIPTIYRSYIVYIPLGKYAVPLLLLRITNLAEISSYLSHKELFPYELLYISKESPNIPPKMYPNMSLKMYPNIIQTVFKYELNSC